CPSGWSRYGSRCFIVYTHRLSMADAESNCVTHHGNLASIHNQGEQSFISGLIHKKFQRNEYAWIGLYDAIQ
ncbi:galactose-specific lectin nattectin-like isoform X3, partial [Scomber scombrus]